ncbi:MAG: hypothetical protein K6E41_03450 [Solobacterium sp.]|nr:hypothetical protein [Solobacterium sp.]
MIREINNQYPEFARPYEPVKGAKKHKRLVFGLAVPGFLLISLPVILNTVIPEIILPDLPSHVEPGAPTAAVPDPKGWMFHEYKPKPEPEPEYTPYVPYRPYRPVNNPVETATPVDPGPNNPVRPNPQPTEKPVEEKDVRVVIAGNHDTLAYVADDLYVEGYTWTVYEGDEEIGQGGFSVEYAGTDSPVPYVTGIDPGTYYMGLQESDFEVSSDTYDDYVVEIEDGWLKINGEENVLHIYITGNTATYPYDGTSHAVDGYTVRAEDNDGEADSSLYTVTLNTAGQDHASATDAGEYPMGLVSEMSADDFTVATDAYSHYDIEFTNGSLTIEKVDAVIIITGDTATEKYDGEEHAVDGYTITLPAGTDLTEDDISGPDVNIAETAPGTYSMGLTADQFSCTNENYNVTFNVTDGWLVIEANRLIVTITGNTGTEIYDGEDHMVSGFTSIARDEDGNKVSEDDYSVELAAGAMAEAFGIDKGKHYMGLTEDSFVVTADKYSDITVSVTDGWLLIADDNTAFITITVNSADQEYTYDGDMHSVHGFTWTAVDADGNTIDSSLISVTMETPSKAGIEAVNAGTYTTNVEEGDFTVTSTEYGSYEFVQIIQGTLTINPAPVTVTVTGNTSTVDYDGEEHSVSGYSVSIPSGSGLTMSDLDLPDQQEYTAYGTDPTVYEMGLSASAFGCTNNNYDVAFSVEDGWLLINPTTLYVTINGTTATVPYDGEGHSVSGWTSEAEDVYGVTVSQNAYSVVLNAGSAAEAWGDGAGKYYMGLTESSFTVTSPSYSTIEVTVNDGWIEITGSTTSHTPPTFTVTVTSETTTSSTGNWAVWVIFSGTMNDAEGHSASAQLYVQEHDSWISAEEKGHDEYTSGATWNSNDELMYEFFFDTTDEPAEYNAKIVFTWSYADGTSDSKEELFTVHKGNYIYLTDSTYDGNTLTLSFTIDTAYVNASDVELWSPALEVGNQSFYNGTVTKSGNQILVSYDIGEFSSGTTYSVDGYSVCGDTWYNHITGTGILN